jgi:hypothetical protein
VNYRADRGHGRGRGVEQDYGRYGRGSAPLPPDECCQDARAAGTDQDGECPQHAAIRQQRERDARVRPHPDAR